jgi:hypothetical protein
MPARSEPLLWVQLIGAGVFPLEALLLLLLLAGSDPGPVPGLERLLCWALGALAPTLLLWHRPADVWSLLLVQTPLRARRPLQQRLSRLQDNLGLRLGLAFGGVISLPLLWWLDAHAAVASSLSPLRDSPRLVVLLLAAAVLALMLWQWQQLLQALWLLSRSADRVAAARPMPQAELEDQRLCLGLPLLLLDPLQVSPAPARTGRPGEAAPQPQTPSAAPRSSPAAVAEAPEAEVADAISSAVSTGVSAAAAASTADSPLLQEPAAVTEPNLERAQAPAVSEEAPSVPPEAPPAAEPSEDGVSRASDPQQVAVVSGTVPADEAAAATAFEADASEADASDGEAADPGSSDADSSSTHAPDAEAAAEGAALPSSDADAPFAEDRAAERPEVEAADPGPSEADSPDHEAPAEDADQHASVFTPAEDGAQAPAAPGDS